MNVILAVSLNVVNGFTGQFSIGHAGFMAVGAYTAALVTTGMETFQLAGLPLGASDAVVFFLALAGRDGDGRRWPACWWACPSLRLRGDYLAIVTLGFGEIIRVVIENTQVLGQATGISGLPAYTNVVWAGMGVVATVVMARRLLLSTQGRALLAIREDEVAAEAMGVDTIGYKVRAFVISAAFAGLAGALLVHEIQLVTPRMFTFVKSIEVVVMVVLGGMGSITGSIVAATAAHRGARVAAGRRPVPDGDLLAAAHRAHAHPPERPLRHARDLGRGAALAAPPARRGDAVSGPGERGRSRSAA